MKLYAIFESKVDKNNLRFLSTNQKLVEQKSKKFNNPIIYLISKHRLDKIAN